MVRKTSIAIRKAYIVRKRSQEATAKEGLDENKALVHWYKALQEVQDTGVFLVGTGEGHDPRVDFFMGKYTEAEKIEYIERMIFRIENPNTQHSAPNPNFPKVPDLR